MAIVKETAVVEVRDCTGYPVQTETDVTLTADGNKASEHTSQGKTPTFDLGATVKQVVVHVDHPDYFPFDVTFKQAPSGELVRDSGNGFANSHAFTNTPPGSTDSTREHRIIVHVFRLVDPGPQVNMPRQTGSNGLMDYWPNAKETISRDPNAHGWDCLPHDAPTTPLTAPGTTLVLRRKGAAPQLVGVWIPDYVNVKSDENLHYHVYFPPRVEKWNTTDWGAYPFTPNPNPTGQPGVPQLFVEMIYRHLFKEVKLAHATYVTRAKTIIIIPIDDRDDNFRNWGGPGGPTTAAVHTLIRDVHAHVHFVNGSSYWKWIHCGVGRVAMSAYSAGVSSFLSALTKRGDTASATIPLGLGEELLRYHLHEIYDFDAHETGFDWSRMFVAFEAFFKAKPSDRKYRIYNLDPGFSSAVAKLQLDPTFAAESGTSHLAHYGGCELREAHGDNRSVVVLPPPFFPGEKIDIGGQDAHHWLPHYFARHALKFSGFERG